MAQPGDVTVSDASWRERAVERSLRTARAKAMSRSDRFIEVAMELLSETGRTDFTVQELVERSKTSLRSFYQHFGSKDELLLALFEEVIRMSTDEWRREVKAQDDCVAGLETLVLTMYAQAIDQRMGGVSRALTSYHLQLAESRPGDYARVLTPMKDLILELVEEGVASGRFRDDVDPETLAMILMQTLVAAAHMHALGAYSPAARSTRNDCGRSVSAASPVPRRVTSAGRPASGGDLPLIGHVVSFEGCVMQVSVDRDLCEANGICAGILPEVFDLGDDDVLGITQPAPPEELREKVELAVVRCPRQALTLTD